MLVTRDYLDIQLIESEIVQRSDIYRIEVVRLRKGPGRLVQFVHLILGEVPNFVRDENSALLTERLEHHSTIEGIIGDRIPPLNDKLVFIGVYPYHSVLNER